MDRKSRAHSSCRVATRLNFVILAEDRSTGLHIEHTAGWIIRGSVLVHLKVQTAVAPTSARRSRTALVPQVLSAMIVMPASNSTRDVSAAVQSATRPDDRPRALGCPFPSATAKILLLSPRRLRPGCGDPRTRSDPGRVAMRTNKGATPVSLPDPPRVL